MVQWRAMHIYLPWCRQPRRLLLPFHTRGLIGLCILFQILLVEFSLLTEFFLVEFSLLTEFLLVEFSVLTELLTELLPRGDKTGDSKWPIYKPMRTMLTLNIRIIWYGYGVALWIGICDT